MIKNKTMIYAFFMAIFASIVALSAYKGESSDSFLTGLFIMTALLLGELFDDNNNTGTTKPTLSEINKVALGGDKVSAIKMYRKLTSKNIKEGKIYVESILQTTEE